MKSVSKTCMTSTQAMLLLLALLFFLTMLCIHPIFGQTPPRILPVTGTVLDPSGAGASGALVMLKQGPDKSIAKLLESIYTDDAGRFRFANVPDGTYTIEVQHE